MRRILYYISLLFVVCLASCVSEIDTSKNQTGGGNDRLNVTVRIHTSPSTYAMNADAENHIETIDVLAFQFYGNQEHFAFRSEGRVIKNTVNGSNRTKEFIAELWKDAYQYRFVIIANARTEVEALVSGLSSVDTKEEVLAQLISTNQLQWNAASETNFRPIPMWGESAKIQVQENTAIDNIVLLRCLARIDVLVASTAASKFKLANAYLFNRNTRGHIVPKKSTWDQDPILARIKAPTVPTVSGKIREKVEYPATSVTALTQTIYAYETELVQVGNDLEATCLVIGGTYDTDLKPTYYRIDFKGNLDDDDDDDGPPGGGTGGGGAVGSKEYYMPLLRNHLHEITIRSVSGSGFETPEEAFESKKVDMNVVIQNWNMSEIQGGIGGTYELKVAQGLYELGTSGTTAMNNGVLSIAVSSNDPNGWSVTSTDGWLSAIKADNNTIKVTVSSNASSRTGYLNVKAGNLTKLITIKQN